MTLRAALAAAAAGLALAGPAAALDYTADYTSFWVLGDSLSDTGNLYAATGGATPASPPYFQGRFSDGPVWSDGVAQDFLDAGKPTENFAYGGARATTVTAAPDIPDLEQQLQFFAGYQGAVPGALGSDPLVAIGLGANDAFSARSAGDPTAIGEAAADEVAAAVLALNGAFGIEDFLLPNLPELGDTVNYAGDPTGAARVRQSGLAYNARLALNIAGLRAGGLEVVAPDMFSFFDLLGDDPAAYGITEPTQPCLTETSFCGDASGYALFDAVHPTTLVHGFVADEMRASLSAAAVPLPAALPLAAGGLAAFAGLALRRRAA